jgi:rhomboid protease GluP
MAGSCTRPSLSFSSSRSARWWRRSFSPLAFIAIFWVSAVFGALAYVLLLDSPFPLIGGYPGVYGLIGAFTFLMWVDAGLRGESQLRAFGLIGALLAIQIVFGVIQGDFGNVVADLAGSSPGSCCRSSSAPAVGSGR